MKKFQPSVFDRIRRGQKAGIATFLIGVSVTGWIASAAGVGCFYYFVWVAIVSLLIGLVAAYIQGRLSYIPPKIADTVIADINCTCDYAKADQLKEACEMTRPSYGSEYVDADKAEQWRLRNPSCFIAIDNKDGELCSCFGVLGLRDSFFDEFIRGRVKDTELTADDILDQNDTRKANRLYISGVVVRDPSKYGHKRTCMMLWCMLECIKKHFGFRRERMLYALAVSRDGERLLKGVGFQLDSNGKNRRDGCNMYKMKLNQNVWNSLAGRVGDWSRCCIIKI